MIDWLKSNWRLALLGVAVVISLFALFSPTMAAAPEGPVANGTATEGVTNLKFGIGLAGGTRIRAPLVGQTAEGVDIADESRGAVTRAVAAELSGTTTNDVIVRRTDVVNGPTVELVNENVSTAAFGEALTAAGYEYSGIRDGVTQPTRDETVNILQSKVNQAGLSGGTVQQVRVGTRFFIQIEAPGEDSAELVELIRERGTVRVDVYHQEDGEYVTERNVIAQDDFASISGAKQGERGLGPNVPVVIAESEAGRVQSTLVDTGVAQSGGSQCRYEEQPNATDPCLLLVSDGEIINSFGMDGDLANTMRRGEWAKSPSFVLTTTSFDEAQQIAIDLRAGSLPAEPDIAAGTVTSVSPAQGLSFRTNSLIIGIIAILTVSGVVFARYRETEVAAPMVVTAFSEVVILLGFAAYLGYPLSLSVIASFIAVLGTGVDDLVIIADEVMAEGEVSSRRVFSSRFKKAFWVIGVAAGTTVIAISPLAVLSLGELSGFAIFTILGVLVGVLITRPAYGDILRYLLTDR
ncbi:MAG: preprotein translocase subunit SecD [Halonotius sp. J07HN6]|nr:MAG: preprotein translocase subunit SecD [Halonotius sp. J07HN6]